MMKKYQFYISFDNKQNTAGSKAIQDCKSILAGLGYKDYTIDSILTTDKRYLFKIAKHIIQLLFSIDATSLVAVQYPLLSGNAHFKFFIKAARVKNVRFFCIIHDVDALRNNASSLKVTDEVRNLNSYDCIVVHNEVMHNWLIDKGVTAPIVDLEIFDYLARKDKQSMPDVTSDKGLKTIAFAGNLIKSEFIYSLNKLSGWHFNLYGPNFSTEKGKQLENINWKGSLGPDEIVYQLNGAFGLIWDGSLIEQLDDNYGSYIKYNNPHKLSLYLAAGLPVIAPKCSAISFFVKKHNVGIIIDSLLDLNTIEVSLSEYNQFRNNVSKISGKIKSGYYLSEAVLKVEERLPLFNGSLSQAI